ncbi:MAG TPA: chain length-determining protein, partial [Gammaproteobacteria bacterium]|nr:chain length-determining protein [Gammaproteobacteria bacterium]
DPELAKNTVQSLLTIFVESTLGDTRKDSDSARKFIDDQIKEYEKRLIEAENRVKDFKRKNAGMMPGSGENYFSQLKAAKGQLSVVELELKQAQNLRDELKRQVAGEEPVFGIVPSSVSSVGGMSHPLDSRIAALEQRLDELLLKYTDKHPDVINARETKKRLEKQRDKDLAEMKKTMPNFHQATGLNQNPVYQQLKISLSQAEAKIAGLLPRVNEYRENVKRLETLADTIPQIEADLKNLNRDYNINKRNYEQLLSRRESARLSERAESSADDVKFRVIDPPRAAFEPIGPNRPLFESVVLLGGLVAGVAFAFFLSLIKPMFDTPKRLQEVTQMPVLGYVSRVWTPREKKRRRLEIISFGVVGLALLLLFTGMLTIELMEIDLMASIKSRLG